MIATDEDALICDLAETYHVIGYKSIGINTLATLADGLRENSRSRMALSGLADLPENLILSRISDELTAIRYGLTARTDSTPPRLMSSIIMPAPEAPKEARGYSSGDDFRAEWDRRAKKHKN